MTAKTGFTLVEVLIAILIFALMAGVAYRGLASVLTSERHINEKTAQWRALALAFSQMQQDFQLAVPRTIRNTVDQNTAALVGRETPLGVENVNLAMTLMNSTADTQAELWRVGYRLREGRLEYLVWPSADQAPQAQPRSITLIDQAERFDLRFIDSRGGWQTQWPDQSGAAFPRAVEITLQAQGLAPIKRLFALP